MALFASLSDPPLSGVLPPPPHLQNAAPSYKDASWYAARSQELLAQLGPAASGASMTSARFPVAETRGAREEKRAEAGEEKSWRTTDTTGAAGAAAGAAMLGASVRRHLSPPRGLREEANEEGGPVWSQVGGEGGHFGHSGGGGSTTDDVHAHFYESLRRPGAATDGAPTGYSSLESRARLAAVGAMHESRDRMASPPASRALSRPSDHPQVGVPAVGGHVQRHGAGYHRQPSVGYPHHAPPPPAYSTAVAVATAAVAAAASLKGLRPSSSRPNPTSPHASAYAEYHRPSAATAIDAATAANPGAATTASTAIDAATAANPAASTAASTAADASTAATIPGAATTGTAARTLTRRPGENILYTLNTEFEAHPAPPYASTMGVPTGAPMGVRERLRASSSDVQELVGGCDVQLAAAEKRISLMASHLRDEIPSMVAESRLLNAQRSEDRVRSLEQEVDVLKGRLAGKDGEMSRLRTELTRALQASSDTEGQALGRLRGAEDRARELKGLLSTTHANNQVLMAQLMSERRRRDDFWKSLEHRGNVAEETNQHLRQQLVGVQRARQKDAEEMERMKQVILSLHRKHGKASKMVARREREVDALAAEHFERKQADERAARAVEKEDAAREALREEAALLEAEVAAQVAAREAEAESKHRVRIRQDTAEKRHAETVADGAAKRAFEARVAMGAVGGVRGGGVRGGEGGGFPTPVKVRVGGGLGGKQQPHYMQGTDGSKHHHDGDDPALKKKHDAELAREREGRGKREKGGKGHPSRRQGGVHAVPGWGSPT